MAQDSSPLQIAKFNSSGCLMEIMDAFAIGKVKINIAPFNTQTHKQIAMGSFYLDFNEWFALSQRIQTGSMLMEAYNEKVKSEQAKAGGQQYYMQDMYVQYGGTPANKLKQEKQRGFDATGKPIPEARVFRIFPSIKSNQNIMFAILTGDGKLGENGQIEPGFKINQYKSDDKTIVTQMPVNYNELRGYCQLVDMRIQAFITKQMFDGAFVNNYNQNEQREGISDNPIPTQDLNARPNETVFTDADLMPASAMNNNVVNMNTYQQQQQYQQYSQYQQQQNAYPQSMPNDYFNQYAQNYNN